MEKEFETLKELIKDINIAMLTTFDDENELRSRPMATTEIRESGVLWFFTSKKSPKVQEISDHSTVNVTYMDTNKEEYVSVSGHAVVIMDQHKIDELWDSKLDTYFEKGKADPDIALLRVEPSKAEYWKGPHGVQKAFEFAKAFVQSETYDEREDSENEKLNF